MATTNDAAALARCLREVRTRGLDSGFIVAARDGSSHHWYSDTSDPSIADDEIALSVPGPDVETDEIEAELVDEQLRGQASHAVAQAELDRDAGIERTGALHARCWNGAGAGSGYDGEAVAELRYGEIVRVLVARREPAGEWSFAEHEAVAPIGDQAGLDSLARWIAGNFADDLDWTHYGETRHGDLCDEFVRLEEAAN